MAGELDAGAGQFGVERFCPEAGGEVPAQPLRASRTLALLHVANYEAMRLATREKLPKQAQALALHSAASAMLDYLFPLESPGRYQALGRAAYLAYTTDPRKLKGYDQAWGLGTAGGCQYDQPRSAGRSQSDLGSGRPAGHVTWALAPRATGICPLSCCASCSALAHLVGGDAGTGGTAASAL